MMTNLFEKEDEISLLQERLCETETESVRLKEEQSVYDKKQPGSTSVSAFPFLQSQAFGSVIQPSFTCSQQYTAGIL